VKVLLDNLNRGVFLDRRVLDEFPVVCAMAGLGQRPFVPEVRLVLEELEIRPMVEHLFPRNQPGSPAGAWLSECLVSAVLNTGLVFPTRSEPGDDDVELRRGCGFSSEPILNSQSVATSRP
jgi:hypothetical protein